MWRCLPTACLRTGPDHSADAARPREQFGLVDGKRTLNSDHTNSHHSKICGADETTVMDAKFGDHVQTPTRIILISNHPEIMTSFTFFPAPPAIE